MGRLWAKMAVLAGLVLPLSLLAAVAEFITATALGSSRGGSAISLTDPGVLREVAGASLYLAVIAVIGLALGALLRRIEPEMRRSYSAGEMAPELAVLRRPAARASRSIGNA
jgi:ABC-2 type transport system permease protein